MNNKHMITVTFIAPSYSRPARLRLTSGRFSDDERDTVMVPFSADGPTNTRDIAAAWLTANGYTVFCSGELRDGYILAVNEFISLADAKAGKRWKDGVVS